MTLDHLAALLAALALTLPPALGVAGGGPDEALYRAEGDGYLEQPPEQRHRHDVSVVLDEAPRTDGVHVVVEDTHAGVHVLVDVGVTLDGERR